MPSLLDLPRDVRDDVLSYALRMKLDPPASPVEFSQASREFLSDIYLDNGWRCRFRFEHQAKFRTFVALQLVNWQLYDEVREVMRRQFTHPPDYDLDIMYLTDGSMWTTWTRLPFVAHHVNTLRITFRLFRCPGWLGATLRNSHTTLFGDFQNRPPSFLCIFYLLLHTFLTRGPFPASFRRYHGVLFPGMLIDKIVISIKRPTESGILPLEHLLSLEESRMFTRLSTYPPHVFFGPSVHSGNEGVVAHTLLVLYMVFGLRILTGLDYRYEELGRPFYERVGVFEIRSRGRTLKYFNLAEFATRIATSEPLEDSDLRDYARWVASTANMRRQVGLPVAPLPSRLRQLLMGESVNPDYFWQV
ncbi:uncharacterized protein MAM_04596 [Metarhizium album ARSEF 1941]|uniref:F-box domain-containing protein n=1 Tax=Metarhizium album (strain ARSEF 1941) TaxID=1081103 RepID=A0A0B2WNE7_METAS|nr:uncharacterized protein MAM_04596 [Metarhizium album ARSEF 1941]KHN97581.1 hypothetical protein MAM_04596 [Metarhizium album ARSEF 1941]